MLNPQHVAGTWFAAESPAAADGRVPAARNGGRTGRSPTPADGSPPGDRLESWLDALSHAFPSYDADVPARERFRGAVEGRPIGDLLIGRVDATALRAERGPRAIAADGLDDLVIILRCEGAGAAGPPERLARLDAGRIAVVDAGRPVTIVASSDGFSDVALRVPRDLVPGWDGAAAGAATSATRGLGALVARHLLDALDGRGDDAATLPIARAFLLRTHDALEEARVHLDRVQYAVAERIVARRIGDPGLSAEAVAFELGIAPARVRMLFEAHGRRFDDRLLDLRLEAARSMLRARHPAEPVEDVLRRAGFSDLAAAEKAFALRYHVPPGAISAAWPLWDDGP